MKILQQKKAASCQNCGLYKLGTQTVFGTGSAQSKVLIVGEQPGNYEDLSGITFIGPAGEMLRSCMKEAGLSESLVYFTNAVKHFKHKLSGKRRIHDKPSYQEIKACKPWLEQQRQIIKPKIVIALGVTAARSILNRQPAIGRERGKSNSILAPISYFEGLSHSACR